MSTRTIKCFVIMPFTGTTIRHTTAYWNEFYEDYLKPLIEKNPQVKADRSEALRGDILDEIIRNLVYADIVVADLTDANPNVYWELGVRQSFAHRTITILESGYTLPFDLGIKGTLSYNPKKSQEMQVFAEKFVLAIDDCLQHPKRPDSHVIKALTGRGTVFEIIHREEIERRLFALLAELERDRKLYERAKRRAEANAEVSDPDHWAYPSSRFLIASTELLVTERYLDADEEFYRSAQRFHRRVLGWDQALLLWPLEKVMIQKWKIRVIQRKKWPLEAVIDDFEQRVEAEITALKERL